jgi:glyoxylase-like metal-dependent hydrolase (beta-lactamase superfamily II)
LIFLTAGFMKIPAGAFRPGGGWSWTVIPMTVAVIRREDGKYVLVDCGFSRAEIERPAEAFGFVRQYAFRLDRRREPPRAVADQLQERGIDPADVAAIVPTHLHLDHVGGFVDFPNAEIVSREEELTSGRERGKNAGFIHMKGIDASGRARAVQLKDEERHGFPAHLDLFGDGRVVLLDARGHTAGSVAVLLTDPEDGRSALMAGDAAYHRDEIRTGRMSPMARYTAFRKEWLRATWGRLRDFESAHPETPVVLAHDLDCFRHLSR